MSQVQASPSGICCTETNRDCAGGAADSGDQQRRGQMEERAPAVVDGMPQVREARVVEGSHHRAAPFARPDSLRQLAVSAKYNRWRRVPVTEHVEACLSHMVGWRFDL